MTMRERLRALPKAHLHVHLEGAVPPATLAEFAREQGAAPLDVGGYEDLTGFVSAYERARDLVPDLDGLRRVAREVAEEALAEGFVWLEVHFSPWSYRGRLGPEPLLLETVLDGLQEAQTDGTGAGVILGHNRAEPPSIADELVTLAARYAAHGVVGVGLVGDERHRGAPFAPAFARARDAGLASVPHAGEVGGPEAVWEALEMLGADRIGHGVRAIDDPELVETLASRQVCLDVCPTSNLRLGLFPDREAHPLERLVSAGVAVSLNSDDPTFFGQSALDEYVHAASAGIDVEAIADASLRSSCAPDRVLAAAATRRGVHAPTDDAGPSGR